MKKRMIVALSLCLMGAAQGQNVQKDIALGKQYSQLVEQSIGVYDNPEMTAYIKAVGDKLTAQMDNPLFEFKYAILATPEPNAFSIPGGHLYITTGMFPFLESEDELACIMAHEIIHANNRHSIKSSRKGIIPGILQIPGAIIGAVIDENIGNAINSPFRQISQLTHASYNRKQEIEADLEGVEIAAKAGYDPNALKTLLQRIGKYGELLSGEAEKKNRLATHPITEERVKKINKLEPTLIRGEKSDIEENFLEKLNGVLAGIDPSRGIFLDQTFLQPTQNFKLVFPDDWENAFSGNTIAGVNQEKKEFMRVTYEVSDLSPRDAANRLIGALSPSAQKAIVASEQVSLGKMNGHMITFKQESGEDLYYGFRVWLNHDSLLFNFLALSTNEDQTKMESILKSLSRPTTDDLKIIKVSNLRLVSAEENETAGAIIERTKTELSEAITLLINQKDHGELFQEGETVKVVVSEKF